MTRMHARGAFALALMLLAPVGAVAQDAEPEAGDAVETDAADPSAADADGEAGEGTADEAADEADPEPEAAPTEGAGAAEAPTEATTPEPADEPVESGSSLDAVTAPSTDPTSNATPPEYKPPTRATPAVIADLSRANGANRWRSADIEPNRRELRLFVGSNVQSPTDSGLDALLTEEERFRSGRVGLEYAFGNGLALGANYAWGGDESTIFGDVGTELDVQGADIFVRYTYELVPWFRPYAQAEIGFRSAELKLTPDGETVADDAIALAYGGFGGFEVRYPARNVSIALFNEHGYQGTTDLTFDDARWSDSDAEPLDLGSVGFSGYTWRMGIRLGVAF